jgi:hypothetical protein
MSSPRKATLTEPSEKRSGLRQRLQILAGFLLPLAVLGLWLKSRGFFASP